MDNNPPTATSPIAASPVGGVIGLGTIGSHIAASMVRSGLPTVVYDLRAEAVQDLVAQGADAAGSAAEVARRADVVCIVVFDGAQVEDVLFGTDGIVNGATPGTVVCVCSTVEPDAITDFATRAAVADVHVIDSGVAGGWMAAAKGQLVTTVGGEPGEVEVARPVLDAFSKEVIHAGPLGAGLRLKLVKNHLSYLAMCSVHETLLLAEELGISAETVAHVTRASNLLDDFFWLPMARPTARRLGPDADPHERERAAHFAQTARKDLYAVEALAAEIGLELPAARTAREQAGRWFLAAEADEPA